LTISREDFLQNGGDEALREAIYVMMGAFHGLSQCRTMFGRTLGLTGSQFAVLIGVAYKQRNSGVTIRELADHIHLASPHVTAEVGNLIRLGLLVKRPHEEDRRSVRVSLSAEGEAAVTRVTEVVRRTNDMLFEGLVARDVSHISRIMRVIAANVDRVFAQSSTPCEATSSRAKRTGSRSA
jgi:DNA-binding MarR family transcriptional regulator